MVYVTSSHEPPQVLAEKQMRSKMRPWQSSWPKASQSTVSGAGVSEMSAMIVTLSKAWSDDLSVADTQTSPALSYSGAFFP